MAYKLKLLKQGFQNIGPYILSGLKFTRQNAGKCSSGYSSKQNFPGEHAPGSPPPPSQTSLADL